MKKSLKFDRGRLFACVISAVILTAIGFYARHQVAGAIQNAIVGVQNAWHNIAHLLFVVFMIVMAVIVLTIFIYWLSKKLDTVIS
ncbi:MAG: hypothetical protein V1839_02750 [archaeon]